MRHVQPALARVVHSSARVLVLSKPPGVSLQTPPKEPGVAVSRLVAALPQKERSTFAPEGATLLLVHRLDVGTSGLVVLARDEDAHRALSKAFATRDIDKTYLALAWGRSDEAEGTWDAPLGPDRRDRRRMRVDPGGSSAVTRFRALASTPHVTLFELHPETGRTHQIRVHLEAAGHPIVGDDLYGSPLDRRLKDRAVRHALSPPHLLLHAWKLRIPAGACSREEINLEAELPQALADALRAIGLEGSWASRAE